jgi:hypothetical protein
MPAKNKSWAERHISGLPSRKVVTGVSLQLIDRTYGREFDTDLTGKRLDALAYGELLRFHAYL